MREFLKIGGPKGNQGVCRENHGITWVLIKAYVGILLGDIHIYDVSAWRPLSRYRIKIGDNLVYPELSRKNPLIGK